MEKEFYVVKVCSKKVGIKDIQIVEVGKLIKAYGFVSIIKVFKSNNGKALDRALAFINKQYK